VRRWRQLGPDEHRRQDAAKAKRWSERVALSEASERADFFLIVHGDTEGAEGCGAACTIGW